MFDALVDSMMMDRHLGELDHDMPGIPSVPDDLPNLPCVQNLPIYVYHTLQNKLFFIILVFPLNFKPFLISCSS